MKSKAQLTVTSGSFTVSSVFDYSNNINKKKAPKAARGTIATLSESAAKRFKSTWRRIDFSPYLGQHDHEPEGKGFQFTLTLPPRTVLAKKDFQRLEDALHKAFNKAFGLDSSYVRRSAFQENGRPHWHITAFFQDVWKLRKVAKTVRNIWCRLCNCDTTSFRKSGSKVQTLYGAGSMLRLRDYLINQDEYDHLTWIYGRAWGVWNKDSLPRCEVTSYNLDINDEVAEGYHYQHEPDMEKLILFLQAHPLTRDRQKVQKLSTAWRGFTIEFADPADLQQLHQDYEYFLSPDGGWAYLSELGKLTNAT